ncbi:MAG: pyruvate carboxylase subunit B [Candidimonas sp.]|nr:MAG: pyruvate carboxylase subunit B [Candidimonas sp.]TAM21696.1 MAG: pyruvate carboxylase subunit B [Candidimonas sp.]TAM77646.1 MAG: pyruvate carboxylase subunit B [Candidimonas sp.]
MQHEKTAKSSNESKSEHFGLIDITLRDAHQCLWSTRMTTDMMAPILGAIDRVGYSYVNILGGAVFDVSVRYLQENPWDRIRLLCNTLTTPCDALTRGQSLYTFQLFPDDIVELNSHVLAQLGVSVLTVYDALNDNRNIESSIKSGHAAGMKVNAMMVYTLSPVHTDDYYVERTKELMALKADFISVKDPTGLLTPERARTLFPAIVQAAASTPLQLHSHCQSGLAPDVYEIAIASGFKFGHTAVEPLANGASLPSAQEIEARAQKLGRYTGIDADALLEVSGYFDWLCVREDKPRGTIAAYDPALYEHQVPGGMISNLRSQLETMKMEQRLPEILEEAAQVRRDLGYPILVSPFAQYIITQAVLNVVQGERYKTIPDEVRKYAMGHYGKLASQPSDEFLGRAEISLSDIIRERASEHIAPWIPQLRAELGRSATDEDVLLHAFYDKALVKSLKKPLPSSAYHASPLGELIRYLGTKSDINFARIRFAGTDMTLSS